MAWRSSRSRRSPTATWCSRARTRASPSRAPPPPASPAVGYRREPLGRIAVFLLPSLKLKQRGGDGLAAEDRIHRFLIGNFAGYTVETGNILGFWRDQAGREHHGEHRLFRVAFA